LYTIVKVARREPHPLVRSRTQSDRGKGGFNRVGGSQVRPGFGREVVKGEEDGFIFFQAMARFGVFELVVGEEAVVGR
jgi:hypothetical protein